MARSRHTRPTRIIAARRVRLPREPRGSGDPSASRRLRRWLKELGVVEEGSPPEELAEPRLPRITVRRPRKGHRHPADRRDIERILAFFGELSYYGVREIRLAQTPAGATAGALLFGRLYIPGIIVIYEQPVPPWYVDGTLAGAEEELLTGAGATIERSDDGMRCLVHWTQQDLRDFMLLDVLMHEIGHHLAQQFRGKRQAQVMRTADHERRARHFASRCRKAYLEAEGTDE